MMIQAVRRLPSGREISAAEEADMLAALEENLARHRPPPIVPSAADLVWYAVHTKAREEIKATLNLRNQGYGVFHPRYRCTVEHRGRKIGVERPLMPRYLFVHVARTQSIAPINSTIGVSTIVHIPDQAPLPIPDPVINEIIARSNADGLVAMKAEERFRIGQDVRITRGPFWGFIATIERLEGTQVKAFCEIFGRRTPIRLEFDQVEALDERDIEALNRPQAVVARGPRARLRRKGESP